MSRIKATFERLAKEGRKALIPYVTAGYPFANITPKLMHGMVEAGANIIELGIPFSDPMADGPVIQKASERALALDIGLSEVLAMVKTFRQEDDKIPVVLMGYANPIERYDAVHAADAVSGVRPFIRDAAAAGVDGVLVVDYPPKECESFVHDLRAAGLDMIFLLAPTSSQERMAEVGRIASGYVYYVSLKGVTGSAALDIEAVAQMIPTIKAHVHIPVGVGFGIRDGRAAAAVGKVSDAVVIGSRIIQLLDGLPFEKVVPVASQFIREIRLALDKRDAGAGDTGQQGQQRSETEQ